MAQIKTKYEFAGSGCLVQGLGFIAIWFFPIGTIIGLVLLVAGSNMSKKYHCEACGNKIDSKQIKMCPTCKEQLA